MELRKATAAALISSSAIWLTVGVLGLAFGLEFRSALSAGEGIGFLFAAIFIALFEAIGFMAAILALAFSLADIAALVALAKARRPGWLACTGALCIALGSPIAGAMLCIVAHKEKAPR